MRCAPKYSVIGSDLRGQPGQVPRRARHDSGKDHGRRACAGVALIEAMLAILVFAIGVLSLVGLQAFAIGVSSDAKYRVDAAFLTNQLIGQMWAYPYAKLNDFDTRDGAGCATSGTTCNAWLATVTNALPRLGTTAAPQIDVLTIVPTDPTSPPTGVVAITLRWQAGEGDAVHNYVATTQIKCADPAC